MWNNPRLDVFANVASHSLAIINMSRSLILHDEDIPEACWRQVEISSENQKCLKKKKKPKLPQCKIRLVFNGYVKLAQIAANCC